MMTRQDSFDSAQGVDPPPRRGSKYLSQALVSMPHLHLSLLTDGCKGETFV